MAGNMNMKRKRDLERIIFETGFALNDLVLYLDTHPDCPNGLAAYNEYKKAYNAAINEYTDNYGPMRSTDVNTDNYFSWVNDPWPWEGWCE